MTRLGYAFFGVCFPRPAALIDLAQQLESRGASELFLTEYQMDVVSLLAALAVGTSRARIGTAVANIHFRHPYSLAMAAATVDSLAGGRLVLGLGAGHPDENTAWLRLPMRRPLATMTDYVRTVRAVLESGGDPLNIETVRYSIRGGQILWAPERRPPILLAALGDRMMQLAAEEADGMILALATVAQARRARTLLDEAAARRGAPRPTLAAILFCCLRPNRQAARDVLRAATTGYLKRPYYQRSLAANGIAVGTIFDDNAIDALMLAGPPDAVREQLAAFREAGVDLPILAPPLRGEPDLAAAYHAIAELA
ncbi:MAG: LLM class F420-dependent oxidoreductase [Dehalococcoidia bacterium]|nr:MAG: LLM class F420-dependent oxidoreductase [Dehalococcoidia bacterium]